MRLMNIFLIICILILVFNILDGTYDTGKSIGYRTGYSEGYDAAYTLVINVSSSSPDGLEHALDVCAYLDRPCSLNLNIWEYYFDGINIVNMTATRDNITIKPM